MPWVKPNLKTLQERIANDLSSRLLDGNSLLSRSTLRVFALVWAGACHLMYFFFDFMAKQVMIDRAESAFLHRWARIWGVTPKAGGRGSGPVGITGSSVVVAGALWRDSRGLMFRQQADSVVVDNQGTATVEAVEEGADGNLEAGSALLLVSPVPGVNSQGTVAATFTGGFLPEDDVSLRERLLDTIREPPHGGAANDYKQWALEVDGVTRAWVYPLYLGLGSVGVTFVTDDADSGLIPADEMVEAVRAYLVEKAPVTALVYVFKPEPLPVSISVLITPYSEAVAANIRLELADLFAREGEPGVAIPISHVHEAISIAPGEFDHVLQEPTENITPMGKQLPVLGEVIIGAIS